MSRLGRRRLRCRRVGAFTPSCVSAECACARPAFLKAIMAETFLHALFHGSCALIRPERILRMWSTRTLISDATLNNQLETPGECSFISDKKDYLRKESTSAVIRQSRLAEDTTAALCSCWQVATLVWSDRAHLGSSANLKICGTRGGCDQFKW